MLPGYVANFTNLKSELYQVVRNTTNMQSINLSFVLFYLQKIS